jgi:hypothetical protein
MANKSQWLTQQECIDFAEIIPCWEYNGGGYNESCKAKYSGINIFVGRGSNTGFKKI